MLENHTDTLASFVKLGFVHGSQFLTININFACGGAFQHIDAANQSGFACTGQADDAEDFASIDRQVGSFQSVDVASFAVISLFDIN